MQNKQEGKVIVVVGMSDYDPHIDSDVVTVFNRADTKMYADKDVLKGTCQ